jgi:hypothetical protein
MKAQDVIAQAEYRKTHVYGNFRSQCIKANDYYESKDVIPVPKGLGIPIHTNLARKLVDTGDQNYLKDNPLTEVRPAGRHETDEKKAKDTQIVLDACLTHMVMPIIKVAPKKMLLRGVGILGLWFNDYYWALEGEEKEEAADRALWDFPLKFTCYDPLNCYPSRAMQNAFQPKDMIVHYEMDKMEAEALAESNGWKFKTDDEKTKFYDYYTNDKRVVILGEKKVYEGENALGFVPFVVVPAGFGQPSYEGKVEEEWRPLFYAEQELITYSQLTVSAITAITTSNAWPQIEAVGEPEEIARQFPDGVATDPREVNAHTADIELKQMDKKGADYSWMQQVNLLMNLIDVPQELGGARTGGVYSARHAESMLSHQRTRYKDCMMNLQRGLEFYLRMCLKGLKALGNDVSVYAFDNGKAFVKDVKVDKLDERCDIKVKLVSESPESQAALRSQGLAEWQSKAIDMKTMHTKFMDYSIEDSERIQDGILLDEYMEQPLMKLLLTAKVAQAKGDVLTAQIALAEMQAMMAQPSGGNLERGGANNVTAKSGPEMVPQQGERPEGTPTPYEAQVGAV